MRTTLWIALGLISALVTPALSCASGDTGPAPATGGSGGAAGGGAGGSGAMGGGGAGGSGATGGGGAGGGASCGYASNPDPGCVECVNGSCCVEAATCVANPDCPPYLACVVACDLYDGACYQQCAVDRPDGLADGAALRHCEMQDCNSACHYPPNTACGYWMLEEGCNLCAQSQCCAEGFVGDIQDYEAFVICLNECPANDVNCSIDCIAQHPAAYASNGILTTCVDVRCTTECQTLLGASEPCGPWTISADPQDPCEVCAEAQCCDVMQQAGTAEDTWLWIACYYGCAADDTACQSECGLEHELGQALYEVRYGCFGAECSTECSAYGISACGDIINMNAACNVCMQASCCPEYAAVGTSVAGMAYIECLNNCAYQADCQTQCIADWPDGYVLNQLSITCMWEHCADPSECSAQAPACLIDYSAMPACGTCIEANCCDASRACAADADCLSIELCRALQNCDSADMDCINACREAHKPGETTFDPLFACRTGVCAVECAGY